MARSQHACRLPLEPWILLAGHSAEGTKEDCQNHGENTAF